MVLAKYQHMSILEFILLVEQHILILCKKSALQCQLTCLYALYTANPSPLPPLRAIHIVMRAQKIFSTKYTKCWVYY